MNSRKMKRNVCTASLVARSAGIVLIALGAILAFLWPQIFEHILAGVGHGFLTKERRLSFFVGTSAQRTVEVI